MDEDEEDRKEMTKDEDEKKTLMHLHPKEQRLRVIDLTWATKIGYENSMLIHHVKYDEASFFTWRIKKHCNQPYSLNTYL